MIFGVFLIAIGGYGILYVSQGSFICVPPGCRAEPFVSYIQYMVGAVIPLIIGILITIWSIDSKKNKK